MKQRSGETLKQAATLPETAKRWNIETSSNAAWNSEAMKRLKIETYTMMKILYSSTLRHLSLACILVLLVCLPTSAKAQFYYEDDYYPVEEGYCAYESNVQDAFAAQNPAPSTPSNIRGRQNLWGDDGYEDDENLHPSDPLPLGDGWILLVFAAITAGIIFIQQRKHKQQMKQLSTH